MRDSARLVAYSGDFERARREHVEVKRRAAAAGEPGMEAAMTVNLGVLAQQSGDFRGGLEYQTEAAALFRELGDTMVIVAVMNSGWCALGLGDVVLADSSFRKGLEMAGAAGTINRIADGALGLDWRTP